MADLSRFLAPQKDNFERAKLEIIAGKKQSHWMWYIFPQIAGLGFSETTKFYEIKSMSEAKAFLLHPVLGERLLELTRILNEKHFQKSVREIFGSPDELKFQSSLTLFQKVVEKSPTLFSAEKYQIFFLALQQFFAKKPDSKTLAIIDRMN